MLRLLAALVLMFGAVCLNVAPALAEIMPSVDLKGLDADEVKALTTLLSEGACPCDPKRSIFECAVAIGSCPAATDLARFGADKFREGLGIDEVQEAVVLKYMNDHVTFTFDLSMSPTKGAKDGRVKIVEFVDFECPHCALMGPILTEVVKAHPETVTVYFKQFPILFHEYAERASRASFAAQAQGKFWPMHDLIFANQSKLTDGSFDAFAAELSLNPTRFKADMASPAIAMRVELDRRDGIKANISGTPTLYINGKLYMGEKSPQAISAHVGRLLKAKK